MSAELTALEALAANNITAWFRLSDVSQAVLFYATNYLTKRKNWIDDNIPDDTISDEEWDTIQAYVDNLLYEVKTPVDMIGMIAAFAEAFITPQGWLRCDGGYLNKADYPELYAIIGNTYGEDGDTFAMPDLIDRVIVGTGGAFDPYTTGGEIEHELTEGELAAHNHTIPLTTTTLAVEPGEVTVLSPVPFFTQDTGSTGGDEAHNNMQPYLALRYYIYAGRDTI